MRTPAAAMGWEFRRRHRAGLIGIAGYFFFIAAFKVLAVGGRRISVDSAEEFAFVVMVPLTATFTYLLALFTYGFDGDFNARESLYPARKFTLPVTTAALVGWPMLYGCAAMTILWLATRLLALWPTDLAVPVIWPALLAAALLAWAQAFTWMPYPLRGLRVAATVLWLVTFDTIVLLALQYNAREPVMLAILAPQVPLAYCVARFAVARARRGDVPNWDWGRGFFAGLARVAELARRRRGHFPSAERAQAWLEWRQHGWTLPGWIAILLPFELVLLWAAGSSVALVFLVLLGVLITPPFMAAFTAAAVARANPAVSDSYGLAPFIATRPLSSAALIAAKLKAMLWSTAVTWVLVLIAIPAALAWSGTWPVVATKTHQAVEFMGAPRTLVLLLLVLAVCFAATWKQLVQALFIGLTGRARLIKGAVIAAVVVFSLLGPLSQWIYDHPSAQRAIWDALPLIFALLVCAKLAGAIWVVTRLHRDHVLSERALVAGAAWWCAAVLILYGTLAWFLATPFFPRYVLMLLAILFVPLTRVTAAPLALDWNRHR